MKAWPDDFSGFSIILITASHASCIHTSAACFSLILAATADGWVRLSRELDTYAGYSNFNADARAEMWMLTRADDVGELLREVVLDGRGEEIDDEGWLPEVV